jgi:hypothetical protein
MTSTKSRTQPKTAHPTKNRLVADGKSIWRLTFTVCPVLDSGIEKFRIYPQRRWKNIPGGNRQKFAPGLVGDDDGFHWPAAICPYAFCHHLASGAQRRLSRIFQARKINTQIVLRDGISVAEIEEELWHGPNSSKKLVIADRSVARDFA